MPIRKIADLPHRCPHPEHNPPQHLHLEPGVYEHTCPCCGEPTTFTVGAPVWIQPLWCRYPTRTH